MPRYFVYVNVNPDRKHITLHPENNEACSSIFQHVQIGGAYSGSFEIERLDPETFKTADKDNSGYWLIVWATGPLAVLENKHVKDAERELGECICVCKKCR